MGIKESNLGKKIRMAVSGGFVRLFRINTGQGWTGNKIERFPKNHPHYPGALLIRDPRPFISGTPPGYADYTGWKSVIVTPGMVGQKLAVFTAIEVKTDTGVLTAEQRNFIEQVISAGGVAGVARTPEEARALLDGSHQSEDQ